MSAWSEATSPTARPGPDENVPAASTLGAFQQVTCHQCTHRRPLIAEFWVGERCSACVEWSTCLECILHLELWSRHGPTQHPHFPLQPNWTTLPVLTRLHHYIFVCFKGFMIDAKAWAGFMRTLTQLVSTAATPPIA
jgi:hypothetical protein